MKAEIKTPREIMIKHWIVRMKEVYGVDVDESDFRKEEPGWQFMLKAIEDFHNQHKPSDEEIEKVSKRIAERIVKQIKENYDRLLRDAFEAGRRMVNEFKNGTRQEYPTFDEWMRDKIFKP